MSIHSNILNSFFLKIKYENESFIRYKRENNGKLLYSVRSDKIFDSFDK